MDAQQFLTASFELTAIFPMMAMVVDFVLRQATESNRSEMSDLDSVHEDTPTYEGWTLLEPACCYSEFTIRELKKLGRQRHIKNYGRMIKSQLVEALLAS
ncbi:Rho termination factor N-terminal domain-containing protein [Chroococcidiopsis sp. CCMEE 29]|uniref:Rho termination factor N-terminal domain-containing protein n=1 Tax=Chroococcidiopsis sp. CCMEE 29 TaxID=155894 RepID=UPI002021BEB4|nr:Rho termination factor N-terminal domain-containing protein [Chroococcidiopsis sp. CCMEE 29]